MSPATGQPQFRYMHHSVGALLLLTLLLVLVGFIQSGRARDWFDPGLALRVVLPDEGLFGLSEGARVELLGTEAGKVQRIVIEPEAAQPLYAIVRIRREMAWFIRADSRAIIRKRFGVAGDAYLEITRGTTAPLNWEMASIQAQADKAPTEMLQVVIEELRTHALPLLANANQAAQSWTAVADQLRNPDGRLQRLLANLSDIIARIDRGEGSIGRLLQREDLVRDLETLAAKLNRVIDQLDPVLGNLGETSGNVTRITGRLAEQADELPDLRAQFKQTLTGVNEAFANLAPATEKLPDIADNLDEAIANLPMLLLQAQNTLEEVEKLMVRMQSNWLIGGSGASPPAPNRRQPLEVAP